MSKPQKKAHCWYAYYVGRWRGKTCDEYRECSLTSLLAVEREARALSTANPDQMVTVERQPHARTDARDIASPHLPSGPRELVAVFEAGRRRRLSAQ